MENEKPIYKRVLLKLSGEAISAGKDGILKFEYIEEIASVVKKCIDKGVEVAIIVGAGNIWRGRSGENMDRVKADHMGMMATVMNCLAMADVLESQGVEVRVQTAVEMRAIAEPYIRLRADRHLSKGRVVIFGCGTG